MILSPDITRLIPTLNLKPQWGSQGTYPWETSPGAANLYKALLKFDVYALRRPVNVYMTEWLGAHLLGSQMVNYRGRREEVQFCAEVLRPAAFYDTIVIPHRHYFEAHKQLKFWRDTLAKAEGLNGPPID